MNRARDQFLARAVLAGDEHARRRHRDLLDLARQRTDRVRLADDLESRLDRFAKARILFLQGQVLQGIAKENENAIGVERLLEDVVGAELCGFDRGLDGCVTADHHDTGGRVDLADALQTLEAIHARNLHVEEDEMRAPFLERRNARGRAGLRANFVTLVLQELAQCGAYSLLVVYDEDARAHCVRRYRVTWPRATRTSPM